MSLHMYIFIFKDVRPENFELKKNEKIIKEGCPTSVVQGGQLWIFMVLKQPYFLIKSWRKETHKSNRLLLKLNLLKHINKNRQNVF